MYTVLFHRCASLSGFKAVMSQLSLAASFRLSCEQQDLTSRACSLVLSKPWLMLQEHILREDLYLIVFIKPDG